MIYPSEGIWQFEAAPSAPGTAKEIVIFTNGIHKDHPEKTDIAYVYDVGHKSTMDNASLLSAVKQLYNCVQKIDKYLPQLFPNPEAQALWELTGAALRKAERKDEDVKAPFLGGKSNA